ncbi:MAG: EAL domain-containing protein [Alphaproteobacteria bacterium]
MDMRSRDSDGLYAAISASGDVAYAWDVRTGRIRWHGDVQALFGLDMAGELAIAEHFLARITASGSADLRRCHAESAGSGGRFNCSYQFQRGDGALSWVEDRGWFERTEDGEPLRILGILRCIDRNKEETEHAVHEAGLDPLTGHYNPPRLREALEHALAYAVRYEASGVYLQLGIDNLALLHDTYGREVAEQVVVAVGRELDRTLRASDVIGRVGDAQFGIILNGCPAGDISITAEKILGAVEQAAVVSEKGFLPVTASIGAVAFPGSVRTAHDAMAKAVVALDQARRSGSNCYNLYDLSPEQLVALRSDMAVTELVQTSLRQKRVCLHFQPVVDARSHEPAFYECLIRILDDEGRIVPAGSFLPIAEKMGLVRSIDRTVLEMVLTELTEHQGVNLAMNISALSTTDPSWLRLLTSHVKTRPDIARRLLVEITETTVLQDLGETMRFVAALREMGVRVALDDFGAGYTSFRHLQELNVDMVKIDGSFVKTLAEHANARLFICTLQSFADGLGFKTVAEYVETPEIARLLEGYGVGYLQGWYFGRPCSERPWLAAGHGVHALPAETTAQRALPKRAAAASARVLDPGAVSMMQDVLRPARVR